MYFYNFCTWFPILMWFWVEQVLKLTNLTKWLNNQNHARAMKIRPKTEKLDMTSYDRIFILDHEETCLIRFRDVFHEIWLKISFYNPWWKSVSHGVQWKKKFQVSWKNVFCLKNVWEVKVFIPGKVFLTSQTSMGWKILKTLTKSSLLSKITSKLSLLGSVALQR